MTITYDDKTDELVFSTGKRVYCFGGNPSISLGEYEAMNYSYGSDGGFSIMTDGINMKHDINLAEAIEIATAMINTWTMHRQFLENKKESSS